MNEPSTIKNNSLLYQHTKWQFFWLCALFISFAYERPIAYLTPFDRTNPRLFDALLIIGILLILPKLKFRAKLPKPIRIWTLLVAWFCFCAVIWAFMLDWEYGRFCLFAAAKYVGGLLAVYMALNIPLDARRKRILHGLLVLGGVFVSIYCLLEYYRGTSDFVVRQGITVNLGQGVLVGPYGASYFQLAQSSSLFFAFALTFFISSHKKVWRYLGPLIGAFIAWPLFFSGARTGLALGIFSAAVLLVLEKRMRRVIILPLLLLCIVYLSFDTSLFRDIESSTTLQRLQASQGSSNSIKERLDIIANYSWDSYKAGYLLPLIGGGFYVAPVSIGGSTNYYYRIDYGIHSIYLFPLEQAGIIGLLLFLGFIFTTAKGLFARLKEQNSTDLNIAIAFLAYFIATLIAGIGGHNFWQGFASGNFNTLFMLCLLISLVPSVDLKKEYFHK